MEVQFLFEKEALWSGGCAICQVEVPFLSYLPPDSGLFGQCWHWKATPMTLDIHSVFEPNSFVT